MRNCLLGKGVVHATQTVVSQLQTQKTCFKLMEVFQNPPVSWMPQFLAGKLVFDQPTLQSQTQIFICVFVRGPLLFARLKGSIRLENRHLVGVPRRPVPSSRSPSASSRSCTPGARRGRPSVEARPSPRNARRPNCLEPTQASTWLCGKNCHKWNPGKWKGRLKPVVPGLILTQTHMDSSRGAGSKNNYLRDQQEIIDTRIKNKLFTGSKANYLAWGCQNAVIYIIFGQQRAHFTAPAVKWTLSNTSAVREGHFGSSSSKITTFQIQAQFYQRI